MSGAQDRMEYAALKAVAMKAQAMGGQAPKVRHHKDSHHKQHRRHKKEDPCLVLPVAPGTPVCDFVNREHRHHNWYVRVNWTDVTTDVDGFTLAVPVRRYCVQLKRKRIGAGADDPDIQTFYVWNRVNDGSGDASISKLIPAHKGWQYAARVRAETGLLTKADRSAWSSYSAYQNVTETLFPARNVTITAQSPRRLKVTWDPPRNLNNIDRIGLDGYNVELYQGATLKETVFVRNEMHRFTVDEADKTKSFNAKVYAVDENAEVSAAASSGNANESGNFTAVPVGDGTIPANPVTAHVEGTIGAIRAWWDETATVQNDPVTYDVYLGTTAGFAIAQANQVGSTLGYQMLIVRNPDNTALALGTNYYVKVRARDLYDGPQTGSTAATENPVQISAQASDKVAPSGSPAANVIAAAQGLKVSWSVQPNNDPVQYEVHVSTNSAFVPTAGASATLFGVFSTTNAFVNKLPPNPPGTDLAIGVPYYVRIIATDFDGAAAPGTVSTGVQVQPTPTDGQVPLATTAVTIVEGGIGWLRPSWNVVPIGARGTGANPDPVTYDVYIKDGSAPTGLAAELVASGVAADYCYLHTANSSDAPIVYGHTYYVGVKVRDADGPCATMGATASGKVLQVTNSDLATDSVYANNIHALSIDGSKLAGAVVLGTSRIVGGPSDTKGTTRVVIDQTGINFYKGVGGNDVPVIQMKTADGSAKFTGDVAATSLSAPGATFDGAVNVTKNGSIQLASVVTPPNIPPTLTQDLALGVFPGNDTVNNDLVENRCSPWFDGTNYWYVVYDDSAGSTAVKVNAAGVVQSRTLFDTNVSSQYWGLVKLGSFWVGLTYNASSGNPQWKTFADASGVPGSFANVGLFAEWRGQYEAAITTDGTNICLVQSNNTGSGGTNALWAATYSVSGGNVPAIIGTRVLSNTTGAKFAHHVLSLYVGNGDFGAARWVATVNTLATALVFTFVASTSFTEQTAQEWDLIATPGGTASTVGDRATVTYIGTGFAQFGDGSDGNMWLYAALPAATYTVAYSWYDSNATGGTHESLLSPAATIAASQRWRLNVAYPTVPAGGGSDDPNSVRIYMNDATPADPAVFANFFRQGSTFPSVGPAVFSTYSEATTGARDTAFVSGAGSSIQAPAASGVAPISGSGDGFMPVGAVIAFGGPTPPVGWLVCDGSTFSSVTYPALAAVVGDAFAVHVGTTYTLPDLKSRVPIGAGTFRARGANEGIAEALRDPGHTHGAGSYGVPVSGGSWANSNLSAGGALNGQAHAHASVNGTSGAGGGTANFPSLGLLYIIKAN